MPDFAEVKYKEGDGERFAFHAETTDKLLVFGTTGRFYTIGVDKLPGGRGFGEPLRLEPLRLVLGLPLRLLQEVGLLPRRFAGGLCGGPSFVEQPHLLFHLVAGFVAGDP